MPPGSSISHWCIVPQEYCKVVAISRGIRHENILSVKGVAPVLFESCLVSKWMDNSSMLDYVRTQEQVNHIGLVSLSFLQ